MPRQRPLMALGASSRVRMVPRGGSRRRKALLRVVQQGFWF